MIGKELEKGLKEAEKTFKVIGKELETKLKEAKLGFEVIGKELEKQLKKVACFSGSSTVQTRRGGIEIKNTFNIQNTKLDQIG